MNIAELQTVYEKEFSCDDKKPPKDWHEQLKLDCDFCRKHEKGDTLYELSSWDGGVGYDYIRDIKYCPICGRELFDGE